MKKELLIDKMLYPEESAGRRMVFNVPVCEFSDTISEIRRNIFDKAAEFETLSYIYVLSGKGKLEGVFSIKELFIRSGETKAEEIMDRKVVRVRPEADQEEAAVLAIKYNIKAIPVSDKNGLFLGVIASDSILNILHREHIEDMLLSAGIYKKDEFSVKTIKAPVSLMAKIRLPWLIVGLFGGILAAQIIAFFEKPLSVNFILTAFIPLILYMCGAVASQTQTLYIRNLAVNNFSQRKYFIKEVKTGLLMGLIIATILFAISFAFTKDILVGVILSISIFLAIITSMIMAFFITWTLSRSGKDPAMGSGPFGTIVVDISGLIIYFIVVSLFFSFWGV